MSSSYEQDATLEAARAAARRLARQAHLVGYVSGADPVRDVLRRITRGRYGRPPSWPTVPRLDTPWQDTISPERTGWRQRAATLDGQYACAVDYRVCRTCRAGWVEQPYTSEEYQRCGLAAAGLTALRVEHRPDLATLGGHFRDPAPSGPPPAPTYPATTSNGRPRAGKPPITRTVHRTRPTAREDRS